MTSVTSEESLHVLTVTFSFMSLQGGHVLTPLPAATPLKPGSAVSENISFSTDLLTLWPFCVALTHAAPICCVFEQYQSCWLWKGFQLSHLRIRQYLFSFHLKSCVSWGSRDPRLLFQTFPFFGVEPAILNEHGEELEGEAEGYLVSSTSTQHHATVQLSTWYMT